NYVFFLFDLEVGNNTEISVTRNDNGNFTLFLFNKRPIEAYVKGDKTLDNRIFSNVINYSLIDNPYLNFTAPETKVYYIEIILAGGGPDSYTLNCDRDLTRYYLPIIPGYPIGTIIILSVTVVGILILLYKKKILKR
ncbi:MAG: Loki-CTERM sorting domain-containing protein, partial [Candidatus Thorarchaeota archaeon]